MQWPGKKISALARKAQLGFPDDNSGVQETSVSEISRQAIIDHRFPTRRRGYDTDAVDQFLEYIAHRVEQLQNELAGQATDRAALDLLKNAERTARDTKLGAEIDANRVRETAGRELDQARRDSAGLVEQSRAEAARIVSEAEAQAKHIVTQANAQAAAIHQSTVRRSEELKATMQTVSQFITDSAADLRLGASRLTELADHFESELTTRSDVVGQSSQTSEIPEQVIDLRETPPARSLFGKPKPGH